VVIDITTIIFVVSLTCTTGYASALKFVHSYKIGNRNKILQLHCWYENRTPKWV